MFLLVATMIGTRICFSGVSPLSALIRASPDFTPHEIGLLHARGDNVALLEQIDEFRNAVERRDEERAVAMAGLDGAQRAHGRLVGLDEHGLHVRIGGQHVLGELERLVSGIGLHLLQSGFLGDPGVLHRVAEARGARLAVLARLRDGDEADGAVGPALLLQSRG